MNKKGIEVVVRARIDRGTKEKVEDILYKEGLGLSVAIRMYLKRIEREGGTNFMFGGSKVARSPERKTVKGV
jgi:hypothetical protein